MNKNKRNRANSRNKTGNNKQRNRNKRGNKRNFDRKPNAQEDTSPESTGGDDNPGSNDLGWHIANPSMLTGIKEFNFIQPVGRTFESMNPEMDNGKIEGTVPSVMRIDFVPTPGMCREVTTAASEIASRMENMMARFSGRNQSYYTSNDIFMMLFACGNIYLAMNETKRIFRTLSSFNYYNDYIPDVLANSYGIDVDDWTDNIAIIPGEYNQILRDIEFFALPDGMPYLYKWLQLTDVVYKDADNTYAQYYYYSPTCFYQWRDYIPDEETEAPRSQCIPVPKYYNKVSGSTSNPVYSNRPWGNEAQFEPKSHPMTWYEWKMMLKTMIRAIKTSSSFKKIYDDFLRVYGDSPKLLLSPLDLFETLTFSIDPNIELIVKGITITPEAQVVEELTANVVTHGPWFPVLDQVEDLNTERLDFAYPFVANPQGAPEGNAARDYYLTRRPINAMADNPPMEAVFYLLLESPTYRDAVGHPNPYILEVDQCTTELVTGVHIWQIVKNTTTNAQEVVEIHLSENILRRTLENGKAYFSTSTMHKLWAINSYGVHPLMVTVHSALDPYENYLPQTMFFEDINHIVYIDQNRIRGFHDVDLLSLFRCPGWNYDVGGGGAAVNSMSAGKK